MERQGKESSSERLNRAVADHCPLETLNGSRTVSK